MQRRRFALLAVIALVVSVVTAGSASVAANGGHDDDEVRLDARMAGFKENPPADPDGRGKAKFEFTIGESEVCFSLKFDDTGTPNRGHIHIGGPADNGGIVVPLFELAGMPNDPRNDDLEEGRIRGCVPADPAVLQAIAENPDDYYCNLHNARFPGGAIRGQLDD